MRLLILVQALAFWPVWRWYALRAADTPEIAWSLAALLGAAWVAWRGCRYVPSALGWAPVAMTALYAAAFPFLSALPRALIALVAVGSLLPSLGLDRRAAFQAAGFLVLSMPIFASLQFYLGYPLRVFCGESAARLLHLAGYPVLRDGMLLRWQEHAVLIDAPCSGIKMLWAGLLLGLTLAAARDMSIKGTAGMLAAAFGAVLLGNILRTTALFFLETGLVPGPAWAHGVLGVLAFAAAAAALVALGRTRWMIDQGRIEPCAA
jgi:exosortase/archaeosortase family protein